MKKVLLLSSLVLVILGTMLVTSAAPSALPVEDSGENAEIADVNADASVAADYTPAPSEYLNGDYGFPIVWDGYEGYASGDKTISTAAYVNDKYPSGLSYIHLSNTADVSTDATTNKNFATYSGTNYLGFGNYKNALPGKYTLVVRARKGGNNPKDTLNFVIRTMKNGSQDNWLWPTFNLTNDFAEYSYSFDYTPTSTFYVNEYMVYLSVDENTKIPYTAEIDSIGFYYKPFENTADYERPELGNVVFFESYENYTNGSSATANFQYFNANSGSGITNTTTFPGKVTTVHETATHYATWAHDNNAAYQYYRGVGSAKQTKSGRYTFVVKARKGAASKLEVYLRGKGPKASDPSASEDKNWAAKGFTLTDEFVEYTLYYDYIADGGVNYFNQILALPGAGVEIDYFGLYFKPYEGPTSYEKTSIGINDPAGIRFRASVTNNERSNANLSEYGFIVTTEALLNAKGIANTSFTLDSNVTMVTGANYKVENGEVTVDKIFSTDNGVTNFTAIVYNIPAAAYTQNLVVRPYIKFGNDIYYGNPIVDNVAAVATRIKADNAAEYEANKLAYDNILAGKDIKTPAQ